MRAQLKRGLGSVVLAWVLVAVGRAMAQDSTDLSYTSYTDNKSIYYRGYTDNKGVYYQGSGGVSVQSPLLSIKRDIGERITLNVRYNADAISAASRKVDAVSSASRRAQLEYRNEGHIAASYHISGYSFGAGYGLSRENDYASDYPIVTVSKELFEKNTALGVSYYHLFDRVSPIRPGLGEVFPKKKDTDTVSVSISQILDPRTIMEVNYTGSAVRGFISNSYHIVELRDTGRFVLENLPSYRGRDAVLVKVNRAMTSALFLSGAYRFYSDSWGVISHTTDLKASTYIIPSLLLRARYRFYNQGAADFYTDSPTENTKYPTIDGRLASFGSNMYGIKVTYRFDPGWGQGTEVDAKYDRYVQTTGLVGDTVQCSILFLF